MSHLFWGFLFMFLDFNLNFGEMTIHLLPDFLGAYLILKGLSSLKDVDHQEADWYAKVTIFYSMILYFLDFCGLTVYGLLGSLLSLILTVLFLLTAYYTIDAFRQLESQSAVDLYTDPLLKLVYISTFLSAAAIVCEHVYIDVLTFLFALTSLLVNIIFLVYMYKATHSNSFSSE